MGEGHFPLSHCIRPDRLCGSQGAQIRMPLHVTRKKDRVASTLSQNLASQEETKITGEMKVNVQLVGRWDFYNKAHGFHLF